jgi:putative NADPH-quinone reductase
MRVLLIFAHPLPESYNAALRAAAIEGLRAAGHEVDDCDLYAENFNPVLTAEERRGYHEIPHNRAPVETYVRRLEQADAIVLCFPTWCFNIPAMLKGFFDRVLLPGVSFRLDDGVAKPNLTNIRRIAAITTYGRPLWTALLMGDPPRKASVRYLNMLTGFKAKTAYLALHDMNRATDTQRANFLRRVRERMERFG